MSYVTSLILGLAVGAFYGLVRVDAPAPPLVALVGLLGMLLGQQGMIRILDRHAPSRIQSGAVERPLPPSV